MWPSIAGVDTGLVPDPAASLEAWARFHHRDIPQLNDFAIWAEVKRIEQALVNGGNHPWLVERLRTLYAERRKRAK